MIELVSSTCGTSILRTIHHLRSAAYKFFGDLQMLFGMRVNV